MSGHGQWPDSWKDTTHVTIDRTGYRLRQGEINAEAAAWIERPASKAAPLAVTGAAEAAAALARYQGRKS